jgi:cytochrome c biogenesis protein CcmG/thiol:disulfide interchange protein DsbE
MSEKRRRGISVLRYGVPFVLFVLLAVFLYRGLYLTPSLIESPLIGKAAPAFSLPALEDPSNQVGTNDFGKRFVLLNVWATWCVECRREHGYLMDLADSGVPIYGLDWKDDRAAALQWLETLGDPYTAVADDTSGDVAIDYGVYGAPETFLIGPDGTIRAKQIGAMTPDVWEHRFRPLIQSASEGG